MKTVCIINQRVPVHPDSPKLAPERRNLPHEAEAALTFDTAHLRADTVTSVLEEILRGKFITHQGTDETGS